MLVSVYPVQSELTDTDAMVTPPPVGTPPGNFSNCLRVLLPEN